MTAKKVALIDTEEGFSSIRRVVEAGKVERFDARTYAKVEKVFWEIHQRQHEFSHVVIDTLSSLTDRTLLDLTAVSNRGKEATSLWDSEAYPSKAEYGQLGHKFSQLLANFYALDIPVWQICHEVQSENPLSDEKQLIPAMAGNIVPRQVLARADLIMRMSMTTQDATEIEGRLYPKGTRVLRLRPSPEVCAGYHVDLEDPDSVPMLIPNPTYGKIMEAFKHEPLKKVVLYGRPKSGKTTLACRVEEK